MKGYIYIQEINSSTTQNDISIRININDISYYQSYYESNPPNSIITLRSNNKKIFTETLSLEIDKLIEDAQK